MINPSKNPAGLKTGDDIEDFFDETENATTPSRKLKLESPLAAKKEEIVVEEPPLCVTACACEADKLNHVIVACVVLSFFVVTHYRLFYLQYHMVFISSVPQSAGKSDFWFHQHFLNCASRM